MPALKTRYDLQILSQFIEKLMVAFCLLNGNKRMD